MQPDFLAINFYQGKYGYYNSTSKSDASTAISAAGVPLPKADSSWFYVLPAALRAMLGWVGQRYGQALPIVITENGVDVPGGWGCCLGFGSFRGEVAVRVPHPPFLVACKAELACYYSLRV